MLDHMSSSGVMHREGRRCGEEIVKHESKKKNISAIHAWCHNISPVVYQLTLPIQWKQKGIHDVFHASLLTPYHETEAHGANHLEPPPDVIEGEEEYEVEKILDSKRIGQNKKLHYLI